jgi:endonuclease YncB( thermonuclease family)
MNKTIVGVVIAVVVLVAIAIVVINVKCDSCPLPPFPIPPKPIPGPPQPLPPDPRPVPPNPKPIPPTPTPPQPVPPTPEPTPTPPDDTDVAEIKTGKVVRVWNSNTITIALDDIKIPLLKRKIVKLLGVKPLAPKEQYFDESVDFLHELISDKYVMYDEVSSGIGWIYIADRPDIPMLNLYVVKEGWAYADENGPFKEYEEEAKKLKKGIWR